VTQRRDVQKSGRQDIFRVGFQVEGPALNIVTGPGRITLQEFEPIPTVQVFSAARNGLEANSYVT
jgi:hypothetical protein